MTKEEIKSKLVFTYHGLDNLKWRRKGITVDEIAEVILRGVIGFAGNKRFKKTLNGLTVIYKIDEKENIVVITYYKKLNNKKDNYQRVLELFN